MRVMRQARGGNQPNSEVTVSGVQTGSSGSK